MITRQARAKYTNRLQTTLALIVTLNLPAMVTADVECDRVGIVANMNVIGPLFPTPEPFAIGTIQYDFPDGMREGTASALLVELPNYQVDGSIHLTLHATHAFPNGDSITWLARQTHTPTDIPGEFSVTERIAIIDGTGALNDAMSRGTGQGVSSLNTLQGLIRANPFICVPDFDDDDDSDSDT